MKLSLSTAALATYIKEGMSDFEAIMTIKSSGFQFVDYCITPHNTDHYANDGASLKNYLQDLGMTAYQAHTYDANPINPDPELRQYRAESALRFCAAAGIERVVVHPSAWTGNTREQFMQGNVDFYRSLISACEETGVKVLIENIGNEFDPFYLVYGKDLAELIDKVDSPWFEACWDTGHANHFDASTNSQYQSIIDLGNRLTAIHFNDNIGGIREEERHIRMDMHMVPFMSWAGSLNYDAVLKGLKDIGYKGTMNFEITSSELRRHVEPFVLNEEKIEKLRLIPLSLWTKIYTTAYEIGKFMLETYNLYED